ncbi:Uncharacterised protein [Nocardia otitidiscaviarum]|uniref:Uncharacterized protein n=1 Tax=Nocardia otitidiscaviarum TaxID=1823 RepID=A0A378YAH9_9NOCA|nr:hypothetical protein [Nocardia otitidiscaviarum]MCP9622724.1 hypothetical protein [Nocardia otitidiscaviarum]QDP77463.1 hypothetical protein FOH10_00630 [Nocardia otitidiscaviarum]SUA73550.1 Uncharacterised protein [Nocardia otitidiscaviarum]
MSTEEERRIREESAQQDERPIIPEPEVEDKHRQRAAEIAEAYEDDRPTTVLPGSDGMVSGTVVSDWVDEDDRP